MLQKPKTSMYYKNEKRVKHAPTGRPKMCTKLGSVPQFSTLKPMRLTQMVDCAG